MSQVPEKHGPQKAGARLGDTQLLDQLSRVNNELVNLQRELSKRNAELMSLNDEKNRLLGMAAHDLRNPLGVILSYSEFLDEEAQSVLSAEHQDFVTTIMRTSRFMLRLVEDLLDVSSIESGVVSLDSQAVNMPELVRESVKMNAVLASGKGIDVHFSADDDVPLLQADPAKLEQVMNNLLTNAIKFSQPGTTVRASVSSTPEGVEVRVVDEGPGIPESEQDSLFKPFVQTSVRSTDGEQGTGLGLAIAHRVLEAHGGRIGVVSREGSGSTFWFILPAHPS